MRSILNNYQKEIKTNRTKFLASLKSEYANKPIQSPFSQSNIEDIHKIIYTYFNLNKEDFKIMIHNKTNDDPYYFCVITPLFIDPSQDIRKILDALTNKKWKEGLRLGVGPADGTKYSFYV